MTASRLKRTRRSESNPRELPLPNSNPCDSIAPDSHLRNAPPRSTDSLEVRRFDLRCSERFELDSILQLAMLTLNIL